MVAIKWLHSVNVIHRNHYVNSDSVGQVVYRTAVCSLTLRGNELPKSPDQQTIKICNSIQLMTEDAMPVAFKFSGI